MTNHDCQFDEFFVDDVGMVLGSCACGESPLDHLEFMNTRDAEMTAALLAVEPQRPLYHWAPSARRKQIVRYGLRPGMRITTSTEAGAPCVCFADTPSWAWALTLNGRGHAGEWDLWQTWLHLLEDPIVLSTPNRGSGLYEVRTEHRLYKRDLWYVGSRSS